MSEGKKSSVDGFALMRFKQEALQAQGWPDIDYPVPLASFEDLVSSPDIHAPDLLAWMQQYIESGAAPWRDYLAAMNQLLVGLAPPDSPDEIIAMSDRWSLVCGPVDINGPVVVFRREDELLAVAGRHEDGRLRIMCYQPLDASTLESMISVSVHPAPDGTVCFRPDNWEYLYDNAGGTGQLYKSIAGETYRELWREGLGILDGQSDPDCRLNRDATPLPASFLAISLSVYQEFGVLPEGMLPAGSVEFLIEDSGTPPAWGEEACGHDEESSPGC